MTAERINAVLAGVVAAGAFIALCVPETAAEGTFGGEAIVVDGDSLRVAGRRVRLFGIDAPELAQRCAGDPCGVAAKAALYELVRTDRDVTCTVVDHDRYGRTVATCSNQGGDLGRRMVALGWAFDYPRYSHGRYRDEEAAARGEKIGVWQTEAPDPPWQWRQEHKNRREEGR